MIKNGSKKSKHRQDVYLHATGVQAFGSAFGDQGLCYILVRDLYAVAYGQQQLKQPVQLQVILLVVGEFMLQRRTGTPLSVYNNVQ